MIIAYEPSDGTFSSTSTHLVTSIRAEHEPSLTTHQQQQVLLQAAGTAPAHCSSGE